MAAVLPQVSSSPPVSSLVRTPFSYSSISMEMRKPDSFPSSPRSVIRLDSTSVSAGSVLPMSGPMAANISYSGSSTFSPR